MYNQYKKHKNYVALKMAIFPLIFAIIYAGNCARAGFSVTEKSGILASGVEGDEDFGRFEPSSLSIGPKSDRNNRSRAIRDVVCVRPCRGARQPTFTGFLDGIGRELGYSFQNMPDLPHHTRGFALAEQGMDTRFQSASDSALPQAFHQTPIGPHSPIGAALVRRRLEPRMGEQPIQAIRDISRH
jgi:hypothetical protein